jgi:hypothetical protein
MDGDGRVLRVMTWNVAAVNNNPFEYFVTHDDPAYNRLMADVEVDTRHLTPAHPDRLNPTP